MSWYKKHHAVYWTQWHKVLNNILSDVGAAKSLAEPGYTRDQQGSTKVAIFGK